MSSSRALVGICIALLLAFLSAGWYVGQVQGELIETQTQLITAKNTIAALERELAAELSVKQEFQGKLRYFSSLEELETWLAEDETDQMQYSRDEFNCIDFALMLEEHALAEGYILSTEVLPVAAHWVNVAVIGDMLYVIEPQDDRIIFEKTINRRTTRLGCPD